MCASTSIVYQSEHHTYFLLTDDLQRRLLLGRIPTDPRWIKSIMQNYKFPPYMRCDDGKSSFLVPKQHIGVDEQPLPPDAGKGGDWKHVAAAQSHPCGATTSQTVSMSCVETAGGVNSPRLLTCDKVSTMHVVLQADHFQFDRRRITSRVRFG